MKFLFWLVLLIALVGNAKELDPLQKEQVAQLDRALEKINKEISQRYSVWIESYHAYHTYQSARKDLAQVKREIQALQNRPLSAEHKIELDALQSKQKVLTDQIDLLKNQGSSPFLVLLKPEDIGKLPNITNPIGILEGWSYKKHLHTQYKEYQKRQEELDGLLALLDEALDLSHQLGKLDPTRKDETEELSLQREKFKFARDTIVSTLEVYAQRVETTNATVNDHIYQQLYKLLNIGIIIITLILVTLAFRRMIRRYVHDNERVYFANKMVTMINVSLIVLVLMLSYMDNMGYLATVLGFASAGLAIAMRDWFMSMLGWMVIISGGMIHVGDRIRCEKDGMVYIGDVLDISLLRITLLEDVTLNTLELNRRAGRIIFVPNNYIFTSMIANYTHGPLKTVWDGIDVVITFDSNHKKAAHLVKEVCRKYAKGYTEITRKQIHKLRDHYSLKNGNVDPRIFTFVGDYGIRVSAWYLTNAYATLTLRSTISMEILDLFAAEEDIHIAYPTQRLHHEPCMPKEAV